MTTDTQAPTVTLPMKDNQICHLPSWAKWKGEEPAPKKWGATDANGNPTLVYRSYEDYCDD